MDTYSAKVFLTFIVSRLKIRVTSDSFNDIIGSLGNCSSLIQLGLIVTSIYLGCDGNSLDIFKWNEMEFTDFFCPSS